MYSPNIALLYQVSQVKNCFPVVTMFSIGIVFIDWHICKSAKTRSDRDFEISLCYTPKAVSCLEEIKYNINHCLELAPSFPKMYNISMF